MKKYIFYTLGILFLLIYDQAVGQEYLAIREANIIYDAKNEPIPNGTILLKDGFIEKVGPNDGIKIPKNAIVIDATGKWVIPGLIETHSHSKSKNDFKIGLALGVTTAHVLPTIPDTVLSMEIRASKTDSKAPRLVQNPFMFSGLWPDNMAPGLWKILKPTSTYEAFDQVEKIKNMGFSAIKIFMENENIWHPEPLNTKVLSDSVLVALNKRAHELNMRVYAHAWDTTFYNKLVRAKVDAVIHPAINAVIEDEIWNLMRAQNMPWITTVSVIERIGPMGSYYSKIMADSRLTKLLDEQTLENYRDYSKREESPYIDNFPALKTDFQFFYDNIRKNTMKAKSHDVWIALGSDNSVGLGSHIEMEMLQDFGLSPKEILTAATLGSAFALGMEDKIGSIEVGKLGDLVILDSNPLDDIKNTRDVSWIVKSGKLFKQEEIIAFN